MWMIKRIILFTVDCRIMAYGKGLEIIKSQNPGIKPVRILLKALWEEMVCRLKLTTEMTVLFIPVISLEIIIGSTPKPINQNTYNQSMILAKKHFGLTGKHPFCCQNTIRIFYIWEAISYIDQ